MGLSLRLGLLLRRSCRRKSPTPAPATGRTSTAPARSCSTDFVQGNSNTYVKNPIYWDKEKIDGVEYKLPLRRQGRLSHHQGRGDVPDRAAHRQARHPGDHPLAARRRAEEERAATAVVEMARHDRARSWRCASTPSRSTTSACAARSTWRSTSRRSSRNITAATPSCSPIRSIPTISAISSRWRRCRTRSRSCSPTIPTKAKKLLAEAGVPEGLHLQGAGLLLQSRPHGPAAAGRGLSRAGRRQDRDPADGVRRVPLGHDHARPMRRATS